MVSESRHVPAVRPSASLPIAMAAPPRWMHISRCRGFDSRRIVGIVAVGWYRLH